MRKLLVILISTLFVCSCTNGGYYNFSTSSYSTFELSDSELTDSLFLTSYFYAGGSEGYSSLAFNSYRENAGDEMTGGIGITAKRDSSLVIKDENKYPQYTMYATSAASGSNMCAVFYQNSDKTLMPTQHIIFGDANYGTCTPNYFSINNTQQTVYDVLGAEDKFVQGDYLKLTISGYLDGVKTGSVEYYLADHRGHEDSPDSVLTKWKTVSLTQLGNIEYINFELSSNRTSFPSTFCFDNFMASINISY